VDSAVAAALVHRAVGDRLTCIFVDHGLLRLNERDQVERTFRQHLGLDLRVVDATHAFLKELKDIEDPEEKRRRIGHTFISVFEDGRAARRGRGRIPGAGHALPDVIESTSAKGGPSVTIKTHHNVGGLPAKLPWKLIEPLRELFKDEVRQVGRELGSPRRSSGAIRSRGRDSRSTCRPVSQASWISGATRIASPGPGNGWRPTISSGAPVRVPPAALRP